MKKEMNRRGYRKILDAWIPPDNPNGPIEAIGCVATSFTFDASFFEEECLARFAGVDSDINEDPTAYLIEREEKLSQIKYAGVLVDQHHARGVRSLRWDLLCARPKNGILHAKVSLLLWSHHARLIVASANLTKPGYRQNHEVFAVLDYCTSSSSQLSVLDEVLKFLHDIPKECAIDSDSPAAKRWIDFLNTARKLTRNWGSSDEQRHLEQPRVFSVLRNGQPENVFNILGDNRSSKTTPLFDIACVVSPFFDSEGSNNSPAKEIWAMLNKSGGAAVEYHVTAETSTESTIVRINAPDLRAAMPAGRLVLETRFKQLVLEDDRSLHAKCLWFENKNSILYMIGSSNFTSPGLGLTGPRNNIEANLCFEVNRRMQPELDKSFNLAWLPCEELPKNCTLEFKNRTDMEEDEPVGTIAELPRWFRDILLHRDEQHRMSLEFHFAVDAAQPPSGWTLHFEDPSKPFVTESSWTAAGSPSPWTVNWVENRPPSGFDVRWEGTDEPAWWPVNVQDSAVLPPPDELKDLSLDILIQILTSARPLHQHPALRNRKGKSPEGPKPADEMDPHRRVDTSGFLLQRTRRVSGALTALRQRLERPVSSENALQWRLRGPVGALAVANAIRNETLGNEIDQVIERSFLIAELCLELHRAKPSKVAPSGLRKKDIHAAINCLIGELSQQIADDLTTLKQKSSSDAASTSITKYVETVFSTIGVMQ